MESNTQDKFNIDRLRFIDNLHTTNRQLAICSKIVEELKNRQVPKSILTSKLFKWSYEQEGNNEEYLGDRGKLTNKGRPTTAINHYLNLCESLNLIAKVGSVYSSTRLSSVLSSFSQQGFQLTFGAKLFYLFQLFSIDADGLILILEILSKDIPLNQNELQKEFSKGLHQRLQYKRQYSSGTAKFNIGNKLIRVQMLWRSPDKYAEHMVAPRCEWLKTLGLVNIERNGSSASYKLTKIGSAIFNSLPIIHDVGGSRDINSKWMEEKFFSTVGNFLDEKVIANNTFNLTLLNKALSESLINVKSSNSFRLPALDTFLFMCIYLSEYSHIYVNIAELSLLFRQGLDFEGKKFFLKEGGRVNESYITSILL